MRVMNAGFRISWLPGRWLTGLVVVAVVSFCCKPGVSDTIYVDASYAGGVENGTIDQPYKTITNAVAALAVLNAGSQGGHTVSVAAGDYPVQVDLTSAHAGLEGSPNTFLGNGNPRIAGVVYGFNLDDSDYVVVDGFVFYNTQRGITSLNVDGATVRNCEIDTASDMGLYVRFGTGWSITSCEFHRMTGAHWDDAAVFFYGSSSCSMGDCNVYDNNCNGILWFSSWACSLTNCSIAACGQKAMRYEGGSGEIKNCVFLFNSSGLSNRYEGVDIMNNCFYANTDNYNGIHNTQDAINSLPNCTDNIVMNPGLADLLNDWNFDSLYSDSPCLGAGQGGCHIGAYQAPTMVSVSSNTYYVGVIGDDTRSTEQARNPATPWRTVTNAAANAVAGDIVEVTAGIYTGQVVVRPGSHVLPVTFRAAGAATIDGGSTNAFRLYRVGNVVLEGFDCTATKNGVDILNACDIRLSDLVCHNTYTAVSMNRVFNGLVEACEVYTNQCGIYANPLSGITVRDCEIERHYSYGIQARSPDTNCIIERCTISRTYGWQWNNTAMLIQGPVRVRNCILYNNICQYGHPLPGIYNMGRGARIENCLCFGNEIGIVSHSGGNWCEIVNTICCSNTTYGVRETSGAEAYCSYSCLYENVANFEDKDLGIMNTAVEINALAGCSNNIVAWPEFRTPVADWRLRPGFPCVDSGSPQTDIQRDYYGNPRIAGGAVDMGVYEIPAAGSVWSFW